MDLDLTKANRDLLKITISRGNHQVRKLADQIDRHAAYCDPAAHDAADFYLSALHKLNLEPWQILQILQDSGSPPTRLQNFLALICLWVDTELHPEGPRQKLTRDQLVKFANGEIFLSGPAIRRYTKRVFG